MSDLISLTILLRFKMTITSFKKKIDFKHNLILQN